MKASLEEAENAQKRCVKSIEKSNDIDTINILLEHIKDKNNKISELKTKINQLMLEGLETRPDFEELVENIRYERYKAFKDLNGTTSSTNSSPAVSPSRHSTGSDDEFPHYNPADFEDYSKNNAGPSSTKQSSAGFPSYNPADFESHAGGEADNSESKNTFQEFQALSSEFRRLDNLKRVRPLTSIENNQLNSLHDKYNSLVEKGKSGTKVSEYSKPLKPYNGSVSPHSISDDGFPPYNPADFESDSDNKGESSSRKK